MNKLYPTLELDDTIDQFQSGSRPAKPSPVDRKPVISPPSPGPSLSAADTPTQVKGRLSISKQESVSITTDANGQQEEDEVSRDAQLSIFRSISADNVDIFS